VRPSMGGKPVNFVSWLDAARYANWLHNGQPSGTQSIGITETGAYVLGSGTPARQPGARAFLPTDAEWDRAAYHDVTRAGDWSYATRSDSAPIVATASATGGISNPGTSVANYAGGAAWNGQAGNVTTVGAAGPGSASAYGTHDQNGNVR